MAPAVRQIESLRNAGISVELLEVTGLAKFKYAQAIPRLRRLARDVDLIHGHYAYCGWLARLIRNKPIVVSFMESDLLAARTMTAKSAHRVASSSRPVASWPAASIR